MNKQIRYQMKSKGFLNKFSLFFFYVLLILGLFTLSIIEYTFADELGFYKAYNGLLLLRMNWYFKYLLCSRDLPDCQQR